MVTPLPPVDTEQVARFWSRFLAIGVVDPSMPLPDVIGPSDATRNPRNAKLGHVVEGANQTTFEFRFHGLMREGGVRVRGQRAG